MLTTDPDSQPFDYNAFAHLLEQVGVPLPELAKYLADRRPVPTFATYIPVVSAAVGDGARRVYGTYWNRVLEAWGDRRLDEPTATEIQQFAEQARDCVVVRSNARGGDGAVEHLISALRCVYGHAVADGLLTVNTARQVAKPPRRPGARHALTAERLTEINHVATTTGDDPALDGLILRLHTETACRRGGALALQPEHLDPENLLVHLHEKGRTRRWQPVSPTLMRHLQRHAAERGGSPEAQLLRRSDGTPISHRRYDNLWTRVCDHLPWALKHRVSAHWLRHTTLTWVERNFGYSVAQAFAGHQPDRSRGTTAVYTRADLSEIASALAALTGEPHPLARPAFAPAQYVR